MDNNLRELVQKVMNKYFDRLLATIAIEIDGNKVVSSKAVYEWFKSDKLLEGIE